MLILGLTGGIASGKSTAARFFAQCGAPVVDADHIARDLTQPGRPGAEAIARTLGTTFFAAAGHLDRQRLRSAVFDDPRLRKTLEKALHPLIREAMQQEARQLHAPYCVFVIPLLVETGQLDLVDHVIVVDAPEPIQIARAMGRDHLSRTQVKAIMAAQATRSQRLAIADEVIENDRDHDFLRRQVELLHEKYSNLAAMSR